MAQSISMNSTQCVPYNTMGYYYEEIRALVNEVQEKYKFHSEHIICILKTEMIF